MFFIGGQSSASSLEGQIPGSDMFMHGTKRACLVFHGKPASSPTKLRAILSQSSPAERSPRYAPKLSTASQGENPTAPDKVRSGPGKTTVQEATAHKAQQSYSFISPTINPSNSIQ
ncbi:hypothetical protein E6O75_ATG04933 [Venturia nashicola]|uniref:Uncharacterized protein n=1 Tax=Venturia nashicola TaxID=86259 RepID=A0A4Z1NZ44_9PEZI|nr:hypothetical protein E6O75_ATG04933 [Venturia nashicola]